MELLVRQKGLKRHDYESVLCEILSLNLDLCEIQVCLASLGEGGLANIERIQISKSVVCDFKEIIKRNIGWKKKQYDHGDLVIKKYDALAKIDDNEIERINMNEHESIKKQVTGLGKIESLDIFKAKPEFIANLRFYIIVVCPIKSDPIFFFRTYTPKKELKRSPFFAIVSKNGTYDRFTDSLFLFDQYIDCVATKADMFIFNKDKFQRIFNFYEKLLAGAKEILGVIKQRIPIDDFVSFEAACEGHLQKISKLKNIASKPYLETITIQDIKKVIDHYKLPIATVGKGENEKIHYDSSDKWAILRLLDDDYLESIMTGSSYEVNSKRPM
jgi:hypothetical protein